MKPHRPIRSYVIRAGRTTPKQARALDDFWPLYGVDLSEESINYDLMFENTHPVTLEIGFGMGVSLLEMAINMPERNFIGIEVHPPGVGALLSKIHEHGVKNLKVIHHDAVEVLKRHVKESTLDCIQIFFPDPWHKSRHHKRRLIQSDFVALLVARLKEGGRLHLATDWEHYAEQMMAVLSENSSLENVAGQGAYAVNNGLRPVTKFELRGERLGHRVFDLVFYRAR